MYIKGLRGLMPPICEDEFMIPNKLQLEAIAALKELTCQVEKTKQLQNINRIQLILSDLIQYIDKRDGGFFLNLVDSESEEEYRLVHSLNVTILAVFIAIKEGLKKELLKELALGTFLHDVGMELIPQHLLFMPRRLKKIEFEPVKLHPTYSYNLLKGKVSILARRIAYEHHERPRGSGYPRGISAKKMHSLSTLVAMLDVYDALTSWRPYRNSLPPPLAIKLLTENVIDGFIKENVLRIVKRISFYPPGSVVKLSSREIGVVVKVNEAKLHRPVVRLLVDRWGSPVKKFIQIDLSNRIDKFIISWIETS